jgi:hypothetical protein
MLYTNKASAPPVAPLTPALSPRAGRGRDPRSGRVRGKSRHDVSEFTATAGEQGGIGR